MITKFCLSMKSKTKTIIQDQTAVNSTMIFAISSKANSMILPMNELCFENKQAIPARIKFARNIATNSHKEVSSLTKAFMPAGILVCSVIHFCQKATHNGTNRSDQYITRYIKYSRNDRNGSSQPFGRQPMNISSRAVTQPGRIPNPVARHHEPLCRQSPALTTLTQGGSHDVATR